MTSLFSFLRRKPKPFTQTEIALALARASARRKRFHERESAMAESLRTFRQWRCVCGIWNPKSRAFCICGKFWQRSDTPLVTK